MNGLGLVTRGMRELALFAGAGGGLLGGLLLGWRTVCAVEIDSYAQRCLVGRQRDGLLAPFPIWDDVKTFDGHEWRGRVDVISGGFPCQDISSAGRGAGLTGSRSGLWSCFKRIIEEAQPEWAFVENSPHLRTRGLVTVLQDLAGLGYSTAWGVFGADALGAPHRRRRMWIVAHADDHRKRAGSIDGEVAGARAAAGNVQPIAHGASVGRREGRSGRFAASMAGQLEQTLHPADANGPALRVEPGRCGGSLGCCAAVAGKTDWWPVDLVSGVDDGVAHRVDRVRATGNGQVPGVAALAFTHLAGRLMEAA